MEKTARLRWLVRNAPVNSQDNGWRFFSELDDDAYAADPSNFEVVSFNSVVAIEPAVLPVLYLPVGTDLELVREESGKRFVNSTTGEEIAFP
jgi:hypothetical protein